MKRTMRSRKATATLTSRPTPITAKTPRQVDDMPVFYERR